MGIKTVKLHLRTGNVSPTIIHKQKMHLNICNVTHPHPQSNVNYYKNKSKGKFHPRKGLEGPKGEYSIAILFFNLGARWRWVVSATPRPLYSRE